MIVAVPLVLVVAPAIDVIVGMAFMRNRAMAARGAVLMIAIVTAGLMAD